MLPLGLLTNVHLRATLLLHGSSRVSQLTVVQGLVISFHITLSLHNTLQNSSNSTLQKCQMNGRTQHIAWKTRNLLEVATQVIMHFWDANLMYIRTPS
jgi:hypothetical protein